MKTSYSTDSFANESQLERCHSYVLQQLQVKKKPLVTRNPPSLGPAITISYQTGSGAHEIAERLAKLMQAGEPKASVPWTAFDRNMVEKVLEEHHLPQSLAMVLEEDRRTYVQDVIEEFEGIRPPSWVVVPQVAETVLHLAAAGHVILVGRGANFITARMPNVFHVHVIASLPSRIARAQKLDQLSQKEATKFVARSDGGRTRYVKAHFHVNIDDDLQYHLVLNTDRIPLPDAAELIAEGAQKCFQSTASGIR